MTHITITPAPHNRQAFARWAVAQNPKVLTNGHDSSAVPVELFGDVPAFLLCGALVDGWRWVEQTPPSSVNYSGLELEESETPHLPPSADPNWRQDLVPELSSQPETTEVPPLPGRTRRKNTVKEPQA